MLPLVAVVPFGIRVVDGAGDPAPCVTLTTTDQQRFVADQAGWVAFHEPGLMDAAVWLTFAGEGYSMDPDGLGFRGLTVTPTEGGTTQVVVDRTGNPLPCPLGNVNRDALLAGLTDDPFEIRVVDAATGRGVPMVRIQGPVAEYWTDSAGRAAIRDPSLIGDTVDFTIPDLHGYRYVGAALRFLVDEGGSQTVQLQRDNVAERLYRVTGRGVYRDSALLGEAAPIASPLLNGGILTADTAMVVPTQGRDLWLWREAGRADYPVGMREIAGGLATPLADPADGVDLEMLVDPATGFVRPMAPLPGTGQVTLGGPAVVDDNGVSRTIAFYTVDDAAGDPAERGVLVLNQATREFEHDTTWLSLRPEVRVGIPTNRDGFAYTEEYMRFPATLAAAREPFLQWELLSPLLPDGSVDRWPDGDERWDWRPLLDGESPGEIGGDTLIDLETGAEIEAYEDSIAWSPWRHRWHRILTENGGQNSLLGEMWYAEADTPYGPWVFTARVATHTSYNSYRPLVHPELATDGRQLLWEATLTSRLTLTEPTPRYDQNQMMYALDLEDERLVLPTPVYDVDGRWKTLGTLRATDPEPVVAFLAPDRAGRGTIPVYWDGPVCDGGTLRAGGNPPGIALFHASGTEEPGTIPLWYARDGAEEGLFLEVPSGWVGGTTPAGYVWENPDKRHSLVMDWLPETRVEAGADLCADEVTPGAGIVLPLDVSASPGTNGGSWEITLDGAVVATSPRAELPLAAGRHVLVVTWTSDAGTPHVDERWVAVQAAQDPQDTGTPQDTGGPDDTDDHTGGPQDTSAPPTDETDGGGDGCGGCSAGGASGGWGLAVLGALLLAVGRRRR